ncbi:hotdog fold thioesterase [Jeongeupia sp. USM3]|uniref:hotdog fold thioesterase n=1 Tax=Jeongeupia sp. USM3 TaxID=1906741 RepID=UPI00089DEACF|nr:hotdog fold thioesterase [Jeongeupia sp. USM3]AOY00277.1 hypothetical protein BJP62_07360 [Jeongeupia sp. USM3]
MPIWIRPFTPADLDAMCANTAVEHLDIRFTEVGDDYLVATMPVDHRTVQPMRLLHGGISCALAETLGSVASNLIVDTGKQLAVGTEINASHVRSASKGRVTGTARPIRLGQSQHVWEIRIDDEAGRLLSIARLTNAIVPRR